MPQKAKPHTPPQPRQDRRPSGHNRHYKSARWQALRRMVLNSNPVCAHCKRESAVHVDHKVALEQGGTDDMGNLEGLCHSCHSRKTCASGEGSFGRRKKETR